jgi:hypothetical protein
VQLYPRHLHLASCALCHPFRVHVPRWRVGQDDQLGRLHSSYQGGGTYHHREGIPGQRTGTEQWRAKSRDWDSGYNRSVYSQLSLKPLLMRQCSVIPNRYLRLLCAFIRYSYGGMSGSRYILQMLDSGNSSYTPRIQGEIPLYQRRRCRAALGRVSPGTYTGIVLEDSSITHLRYQLGCS